MTSSTEALTGRVHALEAQELDERVRALEWRLDALEQRSTRMFSWFESIINHLVTHVRKLTRLLQRFKHHVEHLGTWLATQEEAVTPEYLDEDHFRRWRELLYRRLDDGGVMP